MMFRLRQRWILTAAAWAVVGLLLPAAAPEEESPSRKIAIIVHRDNPTESVTRGELVRIFKKAKTEWPGGERCVPIDQRGGSEIRAEFSRVVLLESLDDVKRYWMQQTMTGSARPPVALENSATAIKYVQKLPGAVAYVYEDEVDDSVRILTVTDATELAVPSETTESVNPDSPDNPDEPPREPAE